MIKNITTLVTTHRKAIARKALVIGGVALGLVAGALLVKPDETIIIGETQEDGSFTVTEVDPAN